MMEVNWFTPSKSLDYNKNLASTWIRCLQLLPFLKKGNINSNLNSPSDHADISVFMRMQNEEAQRLAKKCKAKGQKIAIDLCVNYLDVSGKVGTGHGSLAHQKAEALKMLELADVVLCASSNIAEAARKYHPNVHYLSDSLNTEHFSFKKETSDFKKDKLNFMYAGVACKTSYLFDHLYPLSRDMGHSLSMIMDKRRPIFKRYSYSKWKYETFPKRLVEADVGLAPRDVEVTYDMGHSIFKIGVFIVQGIPVLASPVPSYSEIIKDNNVGMICHTPEEWKTALEMISEDRGLLEKWSANCANAIAPFTTDVISKKYIDLFFGLRRE